MTAAPNINHLSDYDFLTPVEEPIEITFTRHGRPNGTGPELVYVLVVWRTDHGTLAHYMDDGRGGLPQSLSNLQPKGPVFPKKAVPGWQAEVVAFAGACIYDVVRVR